MSPQFVDFDGDGHLDIVAGTFDGSPHVAFGSVEGFRQPVQILDRADQRIVLNQFWNDDTKKWDQTHRYDPKGQKSKDLPDCHLTSAFAWDGNGDGVLDLLLGDKGGRLYLRRNGGKPGQPAFAVVNEPVLVDDKPLLVPQGLTTMRVVDWDHDGLPDLVIGSFGGSFSTFGMGDPVDGGVYLYRNVGGQGAPKWAAPVTLIEAVRTGRAAHVRPDTGLYMDVGDIDGDGDLDLIVGGYSVLQAQPSRSAAPQQGRPEEAERVAGVWLYENLTVQRAAKAAPR